MKHCVECGHKLSPRGKYCQNCGEQIRRGSFVKWVGILFVGAVSVFLTVLFFYDEPKEVGENFIESVMKEFRDGEPAETPEISSAVVNVLCPYLGESMSFDADGEGGSGVVIDEEGIILTTSHIIPQDEETVNVNEEGCIVVFPDQDSGLPREAYLATPYVYAGPSDDYDLAFLEIYDVYRDKSGEEYGFFPKSFYSVNDDNCEEENVKLGEEVRVYGYPESTGGYSLTVTEGVISAFGEEGVYTSAKIDQGNSGGLVTDAKGCFIGIPTAVYTGEFESYGIIITGDRIKEFADEVSLLLEEEE